MAGSSGEPQTGDRFEWDADSQLYFHASTGFYHDPVAGWYYSSRDGRYYIYENGNYVPWESNTGDKPRAHYPCDEVSQVCPEDACMNHYLSVLYLLRGHLLRNLSIGSYVGLFLKKIFVCSLEVFHIILIRCDNYEKRTLGAFGIGEISKCFSCLIAAFEKSAPIDENEAERPPSEWLEETLINMYLSGYSNIEANARSSMGGLQTNEEERSETLQDELGNLASNDSPICLDNATSPQIEERHSENFTSVHESLGEEEERWLSQYGQVERVHDDLPSFPCIDLWDWEMVTEPASEGHPTTRLVGCLTRRSSKLHPSLPARGGLLRTTAMREVHLDLVRVSSGKLYRLRNPSRKYLASLSAYDSSNPTKDWGFPDIYANPNNNLCKRPTIQCQSENVDVSTIRIGLSAGVGKDPKVHAYRDRAAERRVLHGGSGIGPGQKESTSSKFYEYGETSQDWDTTGAAAEDMNLPSSGLECAKRIMENMGWKEGEGLGKSRKGILEPIQPTVNKGSAGLGWNQTR